MRLRTPLPVPCGTLVEIRMNKTLTRGAVCRCEPDSVSYIVGVQLSHNEGSTRGSSDHQ